jgi:hypothetical protein
LRDFDHFFCGCHLEVHLGFDGLSQNSDIPVLDVTAVFTQVYNYAMGSRKLGNHCGDDGVRLAGLPGLPDRGYMIDIDSKSGQFISWILFSRGAWKS